jgi:hypothetical protein
MQMRDGRWGRMGLSGFGDVMFCVPYVLSQLLYMSCVRMLEMLAYQR